MYLNDLFCQPFRGHDDEPLPSGGEVSLEVRRRTKEYLDIGVVATRVDELLRVMYGQVLKGRMSGTCPYGIEYAKVPKISDDLANRSKLNKKDQNRSNNLYTRIETTKK